MVHTQEHLLSCIMIKPHVDADLQYTDIFSDNSDILLDAAVKLERVVEVRKTLIEGRIPEL